MSQALFMGAGGQFCQAGKGLFVLHCFALCNDRCWPALGCWRGAESFPAGEPLEGRVTFAIPFEVSGNLCLRCLFQAG